MRNDELAFIKLAFQIRVISHSALICLARFLKMIAPCVRVSVERGNDVMLPYPTVRVWWKDDDILIAFRPADYTQIAHRISQNKTALFVSPSDTRLRILPCSLKLSTNGRIIQDGRTLQRFVHV